MKIKFNEDKLIYEKIGFYKGVKFGLDILSEKQILSLILKELKDINKK